MILTPIDAAALPEILDRFATRLEEPERAVFGRIADPRSVQRASGAAAAAHQRIALQLAESLGMEILPGSPALDYGWNGRALRRETEAYVLLHEVAHFQVAPAERRRLIDFGLGAGPETGNRGAAERAATVFGVEREQEEALASLLGILWEVALGQPGLASFLDQNWLEGAGRPEAAAHFTGTLDQLHSLGVIDRAGHPRARLGDWPAASIDRCDVAAASTPTTRSAHAPDSQMAGATTMETAPRRFSPAR